jgi:hypothetical protein
VINYVVVSDHSEQETGVFLFGVSFKLLVTNFMEQTYTLEGSTIFKLVNKFELYMYNEPNCFSTKTILQKSLLTELQACLKFYKGLGTPPSDDDDDDDDDDDEGGGDDDDNYDYAEDII